MRSPYPVSLLALALADALLAPRAAAQDAGPAAQVTTPAAPAEPGLPDAQIVVTAARMRGQVQTDSPPVVELDAADIAAYGSTSITDLVAQLAPQTGSGRGRGGRPLILVNGQRIANFREIGRFPPEAIRKVEVLPEEVALRFGYPPDARVINFILKDAFSSRTAELAARTPVRGGTLTTDAEGSLLTIAGPRRVHAGIEYTRTTPLTEAERGVVQTPGAGPTVPGDADPAAFRTLVARDDKIEANATMTTGLGEMASGRQLTLNGQVTRDVRTSLSGLDTVLLTAPSGAQALRTLDANPIARRTTTDTYAIGSGFNAALGDWRLSSTLDANRTDSDSRADRRRDARALIAAAAAGTLDIAGALPAVAGAGTDRSLSRVMSASQKNTLSGAPLSLPGGRVNLTLDAGYDWTRIDSRDTRSGLVPSRLTRGDLNGGINVSVPVTSRREAFLDALGDLSLSFGGGIDHLSDFGTLSDWNVGANWKPTERLALQGSYIVRKVAPGLSQLGGPSIVDVNVPVYDFATGQTVLASVTTGGNPGLKEETQRDLKLSASYDLGLFDRANVMVEYFNNRSNDTTESFPLLTPAIEAAFPDRVVRDAGGRLVSIDRRPVTFARRNSSRIRYGVNLFGRVGKPKPQPEGGGFGAPMAQAEPAPATAPVGTPNAGGGFDPARFAEMRARFCATPAGAAPDLGGLPERMTERLKGADGKVDPGKIAEARARMCNPDGTPRAEGGGMRAFDPARFAALRTALGCGAEGKDVDPAMLPPELADRLKGPSGTIDPARLAEFRTRMCALPADGRVGLGGRRGQGARDAAAPSPVAVGPRASGAPAGGAGGRGGPMGMFGGPRDGQGRWNLSLYHTIELANRVLVAPGGPALDLLAGAALGDGGVSRHRIELEGGVFKDGLGARLSASYQSATTVRGSGLPGSTDLRFGDLATINLNFFADLSQQKWLTGAGDPGFWKGARLSLRITNLFDTHQRVTDTDGVVPLRYQPALLDPTGRSVAIQLRKMF